MAAPLTAVSFPMSKRDGRAIPFREVVAELTVWCLTRAEAAVLFDTLDHELDRVRRGLPGETPLWMRGEAKDAPVHQLDMVHRVTPKRSGRLQCVTLVYADRSRLRPSEPGPPESSEATGWEPAPPTLRAVPRPQKLGP